MRSCSPELVTCVTEKKYIHYQFVKILNWQKITNDYRERLVTDTGDYRERLVGDCDTDDYRERLVTVTLVTIARDW